MFQFSSGNSDLGIILNKAYWYKLSSTHMCNGFPLLDNLKHQDPAHVLILDFCVQIFTLRILAQKVTLQLLFSKAKKDSIREHR